MRDDICGIRALRGEHQRRQAVSVRPVDRVGEGMAEVMDAGRMGVRSGQMEGGFGVGVQADSWSGVVAGFQEDGGAGVMAEGDEEPLYEIPY